MKRHLDHRRVVDLFIYNKQNHYLEKQCVQNEYENYLRHLALNERHKLESGSLESEVTGLLTAGTAVTSASGGGKRGVGGGGGHMGHVMESDVIVEEESRNSEMEAEIELLMESNRRLAK